MVSAGHATVIITSALLASAITTATLLVLGDQTPPLGFRFHHPHQSQGVQSTVAPGPQRRATTEFFKSLGSSPCWWRKCPLDAVGYTVRGGWAVSCDKSVLAFSSPQPFWITSSASLRTCRIGHPAPFHLSQASDPGAHCLHDKPKTPVTYIKSLYPNHTAQAVCQALKYLKNHVRVSQVLRKSLIMSHEMSIYVSIKSLAEKKDGGILRCEENIRCPLKST